MLSVRCFLILILFTDVILSQYVNEYVVKINGGHSNARSFAKQNGMILLHKMIGFDNFYVYKRSYNNKYLNVKYHINRLKRSYNVEMVQQQIELVRQKRDYLYSDKDIMKDPLFSDQWYLMRSTKNSSQLDMNVIEAWKQGYSGKGVVITIMDDGIDHRHPDIKPNYDPKASYDINGRDEDPLFNIKYPYSNRHGTRCAGEVSAVANNKWCGTGIAFNSNIGAVRMLDGSVTDRVEAEALGLNQQHIDIYSGSWGPEDSGKKTEGPGFLASKSFERGVTSGRGGLGNIFVWASGNGGRNGDSCACDGYVSSIYTLAISSVSENNRKPWYLEECASTIATTYSSGSNRERKIITTDVNKGCANDHTGTSASAPLAAGIVALLLEANKNLTWRDVQYITIVTANSEPFLDGNFIVNGANRKVSNRYGFGLMDAGKMVRLGKVWTTLPKQHMCRVPFLKVGRTLKGYSTVTKSFLVDGCFGRHKVKYLEHIVLRLKINYEKRGGLRVYVISPQGTRSEILPYRSLDTKSGNTELNKWPLMSVQFWGEYAAGNWTVEINTHRNSQNKKGFWYEVEMDMYGTDMWPIHLKKLTTKENDNWFKQFERLVVRSDIDMSIIKDTQQRFTNGQANNNQCDDECLDGKCTGSGPQHCKSCKHYRTYLNVCVSTCPKGTYLDNNQNKKFCQKCHYSCDECSGPGDSNCTQCHEFDSMIPGKSKCRMSTGKCPNGFFRSGIGCGKCPRNCATCTSALHCSECKYLKKGKFVLSLNYRCQPTCDSGSYPDHRFRCQVCPATCAECIWPGMSDYCTFCPNGRYFLPIPRYNNTQVVSGRCVTKCPYSFFVNHTSSYCYQCHPTCRTCIDWRPTSCTTCLFPLVLSKSTNTCDDPVVNNCRPDEYMSKKGQCLKCPKNCNSCADGYCTSCSKKTPYQLKGQCYSKCPTHYFPNSELMHCLSCKEHCVSNNNKIFSTCDSLCNKNGQTNTISVTGCNSNQFSKNVNGTISCIECDKSCEECSGSGANKCTSCSLDKKLILSRNQCVKKCLAGTRMFSASSNDSDICVNCDISCGKFNDTSTCEPNTGNCISCPTGHQLSILEGNSTDQPMLCTRIITCSMSEYWSIEQKQCIKCAPSCRSCMDKRSTSCTSCVRGMCLHKELGSCQSCCGTSKSSNSTNCFKCEEGEVFCALPTELLNKRVLIFSNPTLTIFVIIFLFLSLIFFVFIIVSREHNYYLQKCFKNIYNKTNNISKLSQNGYVKYEMLANRTLGDDDNNDDNDDNNDDNDDNNDDNDDEDEFVHFGDDIVDSKPIKSSQSI